MKYIVSEYPEQNGKWGGYRCSAFIAVGKQGRLYQTGKVEIKPDPNKDITPHHTDYSVKKKDEELEI